jgi:RNA polymerase sigma factor (sigma-70 family)
MLQRLRSGDVDTVRAFVAQYEPYIRRTIRRRLARTPLQAVADSADICQAVLATFLIHVAAGSYVLNGTEQLVKLLMGITRRKFAALQRRELAQCRDRRRNQSLAKSEDLPGNPAEQPERLVAVRDLLVTVSQRLRSDERELFELRLQGHSWESIAVLVGNDVRALRKRLSRGLRQVLAEGSHSPGFLEKLP